MWLYCKCHGMALANAKVWSSFHQSIKDFSNTVIPLISLEWKQFRDINRILIYLIKSRIIWHTNYNGVDWHLFTSPEEPFNSVLLCSNLVNDMVLIYKSNDKEYPVNFNLIKSTAENEWRAQDGMSSLPCGGSSMVWKQKGGLVDLLVNAFAKSTQSPIEI